MAGSVNSYYGLSGTYLQLSTEEELEGADYLGAAQLNGLLPSVNESEIDEAIQTADAEALTERFGEAPMEVEDETGASDTEYDNGPDYFEAARLSGLIIPEEEVEEVIAEEAEEPQNEIPEDQPIEEEFESNSAEDDEGCNTEVGSELSN